MSADNQEMVAPAVLSIVLLGGLGIRTLWRVLAARRRCWGVVVATEADGWGGDTAPVIEFEAADGETVRFTSGLCDAYEIGTSVKVRYNPRHPDSAWVVGATLPWILLYLGLAGMCVLILCAM